MGFPWNSIIKPSGYLISAGKLEAFEKELGYLLPGDYRTFLFKFNGGKILIDHEIRVPELTGDTFVNYLLPLSAKSPFLGIKEGRELQVKNRLWLRQAVEIGDNMGTGFFFLILNGTERGSIYFGYKDDIPVLEGDWYSNEVRIPDCMAKISGTFDELGEIICRNKT